MERRSMEGKSKYEVIAEKLKDVKTFAEAKEILTDEEMVYYFMDATDNLQETQEGEELVIRDILKALGAKKYSVKHALYLLDVAKDVLSVIARFDF
jgi:hypothetical protein